MLQPESNIQLIINRWGLQHAALILIFTVVCIYLNKLEPIIYVAPISIILLLNNFRSSHIINTPNSITLFRLFGMSVCLLLLSHTIWPFAFILTVMVLLDILDGYLARRLNQSSTLGLHLDMEVDSLFVLYMCLYYFLNRDIGAWILIPGILRYIYVLYIHLFPKPGFTETKQKYASIIAGVFFTVLLIGIVIPHYWLSYLLLPGAITIVISFVISFNQHIRWTNK